MRRAEGKVREKETETRGDTGAETAREWMGIAGIERLMPGRRCTAGIARGAIEGRNGEGDLVREEERGGKKDEKVSYGRKCAGGKGKRTPVAEVSRYSGL